MTELTAAGTGVIENEALLDLMPHRGKMLLISRVLAYNLRGRTLNSEYDIAEDCLFFDPALGGVPGWVVFEFMAQAISALAGLTAKAMGKPPMSGFLLSVTSLEIQQPLFRAGAIVQVRIAEEINLDKVYTFRCEAFAGNEPAANAKITVLDVEDILEFMEKDNYGK
jgi:predicted hotdog family 3-hydroxylacyl-ACP dehydratase